MVRAGRVAAAHAAHVSSAPHVAVDACWVFVTVVKADVDKERSRQGEKPADSVLPHSGAPV